MPDFDTTLETIGITHLANSWAPEKRNVEMNKTFERCGIWKRKDVETLRGKWIIEKFDK